MFCFLKNQVLDPSPPPPHIGSRGSVTLVTPPSSALLVNGVHPAVVVVPTSSSSSPAGSPGLAPAKADACVGTCSASTMTEPDCLGPCEPGTAVTLEGIVWHETEGGEM